MESTCSFAVQTKILGEGLSDDELEALLDKVSNGEVVLSQVTGGKSLVSAVEKGEELAFSDDLSDLFPLILRGIDTGGIMGTGMEENYGPLFGRVQGVEQTFTVEAFRLCGEVWVGGDGEMDI